MKNTNKIVWITGASSGIGAELAKIYSHRGIKLILSSRNVRALERVKSECYYPENIKILPIDLNDFYAAPALVKKAYNIFGRIDILINNAGVSQRSLIVDTQFDVLKKLIEINYLGTVALSRALLPFFLKQGFGHYVVVSSVMGKYGSPFRSGYSAAKHALHGFFDVMRMEHQKDNINVTIICPGFVRTPIAMNSLKGDGSVLGVDDLATRKGLKVEDFARKMVRSVDQKKWEVQFGKKELLGVYLKRLSNKLLHNAVIRSNVR
ncbi:MAG: SDR family oxidoreductase [Bacteroidota bacterium]|nr:SDR family oxidoreductase [Bacteroidota bacterium]